MELKEPESVKIHATVTLAVTSPVGNIINIFANFFFFNFKFFLRNIFYQTSCTVIMMLH